MAASRTALTRISTLVVSAASRRFPKGSRVPKVAYGEIVGVPFEWNGRDPEKGLDCAGVQLWYFRQLGIELEDPNTEYSEGWNERGEAHIRKRFTTPWFEAEKP